MYPIYHCTSLSFIACKSRVIFPILAFCRRLLRCWQSTSTPISFPTTSFTGLSWGGGLSSGSTTFQTNSIPGSLPFFNLTVSSIGVERGCLTFWISEDFARTGNTSSFKNLKIGQTVLSSWRNETHLIDRMGCSGCEGAQGMTGLTFLNRSLFGFITGGRPVWW